MMNANEAAAANTAIATLGSNNLQPPIDTPPQHSFSARLRNWGTLLMTAATLVGCGSPKNTPLEVEAEAFRTNSAAFTGQTEIFEAFYTKDSTGQTVSLGPSCGQRGCTTHKPVEASLWQYEFFSDKERSLKVGAVQSHIDVKRDKVLVTLPVEKVEPKSFAVQWERLSFRGVDDAHRPVNPSAGQNGIPSR